jgi:hypothetical protein
MQGDRLMCEKCDGGCALARGERPTSGHGRRCCVVSADGNGRDSVRARRGRRVARNSWERARLARVDERNVEMRRRSALSMQRLVARMRRERMRRRRRLDEARIAPFARRRVGSRARRSKCRQEHDGGNERGNDSRARISSPRRKTRDGRQIGCMRGVGHDPLCNLRHCHADSSKRARSFRFVTPAPSFRHTKPGTRTWHRVTFGRRHPSTW